MFFFTRRCAIVVLIVLAVLATLAIRALPSIVAHPFVERLLSGDGRYRVGQADTLTLAAQIYCAFLSLSCVALAVLVWARRIVRSAGAYLGLILLLGLVLRLVCAFIFEGAPDVRWSMGFIETVHRGENPWIHDRLHYPPIHLAYLLLADRLSAIANIPVETAVRIPWIVLDVLSALLLYLIVRARGGTDRSALFAAGLLALSPYPIAVSAFQGACDSSWIFWTLFAFYVLEVRDDLAGLAVSALLLGVGIASKPIPLLVVPAFALSRRTWPRRVLYAVLSLAPLLALTVKHFTYPEWGFYGFLRSYGTAGPAYGIYGIPSFVLMLTRIDAFQSAPSLLELNTFLARWGDLGWKIALVAVWAALAWRRNLANSLVVTFAIVLTLTMRSFTNYFVWLLPFLLIAEDPLAALFALAAGLYALVVSPLFLSELIGRDLYMRELFGAALWLLSALSAVSAVAGRDLFVGIERSFLSFRPRLFASFRSRAALLPDAAASISGLIRRHRALIVAVIFLLAFFLRVLYVIDNRAYAFPNYHENGMIARSLLAGQGYAGGAHLGPPATTAFMAPAYPLLLAGYFATVGEGNPELLLVLQCLVGALSCVLVFSVARHATRRSAVAALAGILAACSYFLIQTSSWMNVAVYTTFLLLAIIRLIQVNRESASIGKDCALGALVGVSALVEPVALSFYPFALLYMRLPRRTSWGRTFASWACAILCSAVVLAPWSIRNAVVFKRFVPVKSAWWYNFWRGNNPYATGGDRRTKDTSSPQYLTSEDWRELNTASTEIDRYDYLKHRAFQFIRDHPGRFLLLRAKSALFFWTGQNVWHAFAWAPEHPITLPLNILLLGFALAGMCVARTRRVAGMWLIAIVLLTFPIPYYLCHSDIQYRYRMPLDPLLIIYGSLAIVAAFERPSSPPEEEWNAPE
ncbi:MAG: glycosyltransferase family 39 protein [Planctomycetota bacterium]